MPIGVPKVAYRVPGSQQADWYVVEGLRETLYHVRFRSPFLL